MTWKEGDDKWKRMRQNGFRAAFTCDYRKQGRLVTSQLWLKDGVPWSQWFGSYDTITEHVADDARRDHLRPIFLHGPSPGGDGEHFRLNSADMGRRWMVSYGLGADEVLSEVASQPGDAWRPDVLAPYLDGGQLRFMFVRVANRERVDWRFRMDMSLEQYQAESSEQKRQGLFPLTLVSYRGDADVRYAAVWVRYRLVGDGAAKK
jgi:hypothetical protein